MPTAKKLPSGRYNVKVYDYTDQDGKRHYKSFTADTKKQAELLATEYSIDRKPKQTGITFAEAAEKLFAIKSNVYSPTTLRDYILILNRLKADFSHFCNKDIYSVTQTDMQALLNDFACSDKPKTVRNKYSFICSVIKQYIPDFRVNVKLPQKEVYKYVVPTEKDIKRLLKYVEGKEIEVPILLAIFGMLREGEICGLTIDDVDGNKIVVNKSLARAYRGNTIKQPKNYSSNRIITVPDFVADKIRAKGYITTYVPNSINKALTSCLNALDIPHFRFHDLRHYGTSLLLADNSIDKKFIQQRGGWNSPKMIDTVYGHFLPDREEEENEKINSVFKRFA